MQVVLTTELLQLSGCIICMGTGHKTFTHKNLLILNPQQTNFLSSCTGPRKHYCDNWQVTMSDQMQQQQSERGEDWCTSRKVIKVWVYCKFVIISWYHASFFVHYLHHLTLQHYWWSSWYWNLKTQVDDKPHECLWKTSSHHTQCPTVQGSRPPDDQRCR